MTITLQDVADAAGVSRSTASRALSGSPLISPDTQLAVQSAAERLGYRVNRAASALRSRQTHLIGLVLNNLINASFHTIAEVVQRRAHKERYQVILMISDADPKRERELLSTLSEHHVDGLIIIGTGENVRFTNSMIMNGTPVVSVIRGPAGSAAPAVLASDRDGAAQATAHLIALGHQRIGYIGGPTNTNSGAERFAGYLDALSRAGIASHDSLIERGPFEPEFGSAATHALLARRPDITAMFAANHEAVFGVLPALVARSVHMPDELSLVCYEDIPWFQWWSPPVTVVDNGAHELADLAMDLLLGQIARPNPRLAARGGRTYRVGAALIERESTAAPRKAARLSAARRMKVDRRC
jgi:LacI family transcriptional regulator